MAQKKKNSNYVTDKTTKNKNEKAVAERKKQLKKKLTPIIITAVAVLLIVGAVFAIGIPLGMFDYTPEATEHISITLGDYGTLHVELYGDDAPETVKNFKKLADDKKLIGYMLHTYKDGLFYGGSKIADGGKNGIKGEFEENGVENKVSHKRGVISMARGESNDSAYAQFFIVTEDSEELDGKYAAFACITDGMEIIDEILSKVKMDENGNIDFDSCPKITSISSHDAHSH